MIYLCGGFKSGWQDQVMEARSDFAYFDPRENPAGWSSAKYTEADLAAIQKSDLVFAYLEASNPGGFNAAFEIGYAVALDIPVILVIETFNRRYSMLVAKSYATFHDFELALDWFVNNFTEVQRDRS